jgi:hypothetical protein
MRQKPLGFHLLFLPSLLFVANVGAQGNQNAIEVPVGLSLLLKAKGEGVQICDVSTEVGYSRHRPLICWTSTESDRTPLRRPYVAVQ